LRELAFLNKGLHILLRDERTETVKEESFCYSGGLMSFIEYLERGKDI
jgi:DNA gyrase subunit B